MNKGIQVRQSLTINATAEELFAFWRRFSNFPRFMKHVISVDELDGNRSHWIVKAPAGRTVEWDAEIVDEVPGRLIAWRTVGDADIRHGGRIEFTPATGGRGTVAAVRMSYESPAGPAGALLAKLFGEEPEMQIRDDLRRFKSLVETGEIPTTEGQSSGRGRDAAKQAREEDRVMEESEVTS